MSNRGKEKTGQTASYGNKSRSPDEDIYHDPTTKAYGAQNRGSGSFYSDARIRAKNSGMSRFNTILRFIVRAVASLPPTKSGD